MSLIVKTIFNPHSTIDEQHQYYAKKVCEIYYAETGKLLDVSRVRNELYQYPSALAESDGDLIGFAYTTRFGPNILELLNIFISKEYRDRGIGSKLLQTLEKDAARFYDAIILVNSLLYEMQAQKKMATDFYKRNEYKLVIDVNGTNVWVKKFRKPEKRPT